MKTNGENAASNAYQYVGFLIVTFLYQGMPVPEFLRKRIARIVPLA